MPKPVATCVRWQPANRFPVVLGRHQARDLSLAIGAMGLSEQLHKADPFLP